MSELSVESMISALEELRLRAGKKSVLVSPTHVLPANTPGHRWKLVTRGNGEVCAIEVPTDKLSGL